jgi:signal peptidase I
MARTTSPEMTVEPGLPQHAAAGDHPAPPDARKPTGKRGAFGCLLEIVETLVLTVVIFLGIQVFVAQPFKVEGGSMENTLLDGQFVLVDKLTPRWATYVRGDIVVLDPPVDLEQNGGTPFIKRVIGLPGDRVELRDGTVYVNAAALDEPYIFTEGGVRQPTDPLGGPSEWLVPEGQLLVMGDHRMNSSDSRRFGPVEISHVIGRAWLRYWPLDTFGTLPLPSYSTEGGGLVE